ncbi:MAG: hypothetical protein IH610_03205 [Deltaproteobacteria bacterium]|nr:hypothetical protein [Deltaproteobacteria bacterium]
MRRTLSIFAVLLLAGLSACGGGGGGSSALPYNGLTTPAVITTSNADNIARQAFQGGDLGANATLAPAHSDMMPPMAARPAALTLVQILTKASTAVLLPTPAGKGPSPRAVVPYDNTEMDGMGGSAHYMLSVNDQTGAFTGTIAFSNFHGDGGGALNGTVSVSGVVSQDSMQLLCNFRSVTIVDGTANVTAVGTMDLIIGTGGGQATLNLCFTDNGTGKGAWLSDYTVAVTDLGGTTDVRTFGRIYLHDYGYVDVWTEAPFLYPALSTQPTSGVITLTGDNDCRARLTVVDAATYTVELDADGNQSYEWSVTHAW